MVTYVHPNIYRLTAALLIWLVLSCDGSARELSRQFSGQVIAVTDGDTVKVLNKDNVVERIRVAGIDAPEKKQPFGTQSKHSLSALTFDKKVDVFFDKRDRYGRIIGKIVIGNTDVGLEQVRRGLAWHYKRYMSEQSPGDQSSYAKAEEEASAAKRGLWRDPVPVAPWDWRHKPK
jgi:endonuclease YncB( thermonuclease family)